VSMRLLTATQRLKWFAPTPIENNAAPVRGWAYYIPCLSSSPCARTAVLRSSQGRVFATGNEGAHRSSFGQPRFPKALDEQLP
jgi:hypothetical protein